MMGGYNSENLLTKIIEIQEIVLREQKRGYLNQKQMYNELIAPKYFISTRTYYNYLGRNAKKELADIKERKRLKEIADRERKKMISEKTVNKFL